MSSITGMKMNPMDVIAASENSKQMENAALMFTLTPLTMTLLAVTNMHTFVLLICQPQPAKEFVEKLLQVAFVAVMQHVIRWVTAVQMSTNFVITHHPVIYLMALAQIAVASMVF
jgi:hypothetical protein